MNKLKVIAAVQFGIAVLIVAALVAKNTYFWFGVDIMILVACCASGAVLLKLGKKLVA